MTEMTEMTETYTKKQFLQKMNDGETPKRYLIFAGKGYVPFRGQFTIYQEFNNLTNFLNARQAHIENGLNVLCFA